MILSVFLILFLLSIALIISGELANEAVITIAGLSLLAVLGSVMLAGNLEYQTGQTVTYSYTYQNDSNTTITDIDQSIVDDYQTFTGWENHIYGYTLVVSSILGTVSVLLGILRRNKGEREE